MADALLPVEPGATRRHRVTWRDDDPAAHQLRADQHGGIGCSCTDDRVTVPWGAPLAEVWEAWALVAHRHPDRPSSPAGGGPC